jgi:hypothetical protein
MAIITWLDDFAWQHRKQLFGSLSAKRRQYLESLEERHQHQALIWMVMHRGGGQGKGIGVRLDFEQMAEKLSSEGRALLEANPPVDRPVVARKWVQLAQLHRLETVGIEGMLPPLNKDALKELQRFSGQELTTAQQDALASISPPLRKFRECLALYLLPVDRLAEAAPDDIKHGVHLHGQHRPADGGASSAAP